MLSYISNGGRLGENISFIYGILKFAEINRISQDQIIINKNYKSKALIKTEKDNSVFIENEEMFQNISDCFKDNIPLGFFDKFKIIDIKCRTDISQLYNFYKYNCIDKNSDIIFKNWWSLDKYWMNHNLHFDYKLLNKICRPVDIVNRLYKKYKSILNKSCAIHIRRGDFLALNNKNILMDDLQNNINYYFGNKKLYTESDIENLLTEKIKKYNNILVFSDDINWCIDNYNYFQNVFFIQNQKPYEDMILMSICDDIVINTGSFFSRVASILNFSNKLCLNNI